jgi:hypothetical protein
MSPWADLTLSGTSVTEKASLDPALTPEGLRRRAADYAGGSDPATTRISPIFADLTGLPPQVESAAMLGGVARLGAFRLSRPGASFVAMIGLSTAPSCQRRPGASSERLSEFLASFWRLGPHDLAL